MRRWASCRRSRPWTIRDPWRRRTCEDYSRRRSQAGGHDPVAERLAEIPEVLEAHTITGAGDMLCRVVARSNADLQRVIDAIVSTEGVVRSATLISLATQVPYRVFPLVRVASGRGR